MVTMHLARLVVLVVVVAACGDSRSTATDAVTPDTASAVDADGTVDAVAGNLTVIRNGPGVIWGGPHSPRGDLSLINCGARCTGQVEVPSTVILFAETPPGGSVTVDGGCVPPNCEFPMDQPTTLTFTFTGDPVPCPLTVNRVGAGRGRVTSVPPGVDCGADCDQIYPYDTEITLTATAEAGSTFRGFESGRCDRASAPGTCVVRMAAVTFVQLRFE